MTKSFPWLSALLVLAGFFLLTNDAGAIGFILLLLGGAWIASWYMTKNKTGLYIMPNAGHAGAILIHSRDQEFLVRVALTLRNIIDADDPISAQISIDSRNISIDGNTHSNIIFDSSIGGDLVNSVD